ncbi:hypothetical protein MNBD_GAMMA23-290 [hydrothermal vent metagenome]|uniref:Uncharacterized protein n=1 Tax=hydrothermal vent metagenome TaxID=652676 RepID=A0A3B0ZY06_9ZZZZ
MLSILKKIRPMRVVLISLAILSLIFKAKTGTPVSYDGWPMIETVFIPVMAPLITMVLLLDSLIATIWLSQSTGEEKNRYRLILGCNITTIIIMLTVWIPVFVALLT